MSEINRGGGGLGGPIPRRPGPSIIPLILCFSMKITVLRGLNIFLISHLGRLHLHLHRQLGPGISLIPSARQPPDKQAQGGDTPREPVWTSGEGGFLPPPPILPLLPSQGCLSSKLASMKADFVMERPQDSGISLMR